jgi:hypothetical protein
VCECIKKKVKRCIVDKVESDLRPFQCQWPFLAIASLQRYQLGLPCYKRLCMCTRVRGGGRGEAGSEG